MSYSLISKKQQCSNRTHCRGLTANVRTASRWRLGPMVDAWSGILRVQTRWPLAIWTEQSSAQEQSQTSPSVESQRNTDRCRHSTVYANSRRNTRSAWRRGIGLLPCPQTMNYGRHRRAAVLPFTDAAAQCDCAARKCCLHSGNCSRFTGIGRYLLFVTCFFL